MDYEARADIEAMLDEHAPLPAIESYLDARRELSDDEQAALRLYAWVGVERGRRRRALTLTVGRERRAGRAL